MLLSFLKLKHMKNHKLHNCSVWPINNKLFWDFFWQKDYAPVKQEPAVEVEPLTFHLKKLQLQKIPANL